MPDDPRNTRREYSQRALTRADLHADPLLQFRSWLHEAVTAELTDATAMSLATADAQGRPTARIVLLKEYNEQGFVWFTDYRSRKGADLAVNPRASLLFYWRELERQVRIDGTVSRATREESAAYFLSRPEDSRYSAAASQQSASIADRGTLEARVDALRVQYPNGEVPPPESWGGYRLVPETYEFWQGRVGRLHDRFEYALDGERWEITRLQP